MSVTCFKKVVDEFKAKARENRFNVRDFTYDEEQLKSGKSELTKLHTDKKKQFGPLVRSEMMMKSVTTPSMSVWGLSLREILTS